LWEVSEQKLLRYRCHVGHGYTADTLMELQSAELEQALWTGVRILEDQAELQRRMSSRWEATGNQSLRRRFEANAKDHMRAADLIRTLLTGQTADPDRAAESTTIQREYAIPMSAKAGAAAQKEARSSK
jgi:two-component system chemotaxis response regulator CheB